MAQPAGARDVRGERPYDPDEIVRAVRVVADGQAMLHPAAARRLIDHYHRTSGRATHQVRARIDRLTPRERDVLACSPTARPMRRLPPVSVCARAP